MLPDIHVTFNADGWPARKVAMFSLLFGAPPMSKWTKIRLSSFKLGQGAICKVLGHRMDTEDDKKYKLCARCVTFLGDPDEIESNIKGKK